MTNKHHRDIVYAWAWIGGFLMCGSIFLVIFGNPGWAAASAVMGLLLTGWTYFANAHNEKDSDDER